jgi:hypothetical protein
MNEDQDVAGDSALTYFLSNYQRINDWSKILEKIERGEKEDPPPRQICMRFKKRWKWHLEDTSNSFYEE